MALITRDDYLDCMTFRATKRPIFVELFGPLVGLEDEWRVQGASEEEINLTAFGFDYLEPYYIGATTGHFGGPVQETLEENDRQLIYRDGMGRKTMLIKGAASVAHPIEYPVKDMDSWLKMKPRYTYSESRFERGWAGALKKAVKEGKLVVAAIPGGFGEPRELMGEETLCTACYDQPELIHDILDTIGETAERVLDRVTREGRIDMLAVWDDMAGKGGPLFGPAQVREFIAPYYRRIWDLLSSRGARVFKQDSDGDVRPIIPALLESGLTCMYPMEPAAGMDIVEVRKTYGKKLALQGGIDKHALRNGEQAIIAELEYKMQPMMREGGVIFGLDHRIPNGTPLAAYRFYVRKARELLGLDPNPEPGWGRMAL